MSKFTEEDLKEIAIEYADYCKTASICNADPDFDLWWASLNNAVKNIYPIEDSV